MVVVGSMVACYIWIGRQQEERMSHRAKFELLKPPSPPPVTHSLHQGHTSNIAAPDESMGVICIQTTMVRNVASDPLREGTTFSEEKAR